MRYSLEQTVEVHENIVNDLQEKYDQADEDEQADLESELDDAKTQLE